MDHVTSPSPHRGPYAWMSDEELSAAYEAVAIDPDSRTAPILLEELQHRGIAVTEAATLSDDELRRAFERTSGEPGNLEADALLAEIERRGLDV